MRGPGGGAWQGHPEALPPPAGPHSPVPSRARPQPPPPPPFFWPAKTPKSSPTKKVTISISAEGLEEMVFS